MRQIYRLPYWRPPPISRIKCTASSLATRQPWSRAYSKSAASKEADESTPQFPEAASIHHSDLPSFLAYTKRTGLDEKSTIYVGTHYEYTVAAALARHGFSLRRIGGASDRGTDLGPATKGTRDALRRSRWPMAFACCSKDGALTQMLWNQRAEEQGLEGFGVALKHGEAGEDPEVVLVRNGQVIE
ncbi:hypothetical protein HIM_02560 [Hirsutella minnesotensis 3608]|nr:hypothetical protein HIM_02560 [Hirsutella minnesotensis 3608]